MVTSDKCRREWRVRRARSMFHGMDNEWQWLHSPDKPPVEGFRAGRLQSYRPDANKTECGFSRGRCRTVNFCEDILALRPKGKHGDSSLVARNFYLRGRA